MKATDTRIPNKASNASAKKRILQISAGGIFALVAILGVTNPNREDYLAFAVDKAHKLAEQECEGLNQGINFGMLSIPNRDMCRVLVRGSDLVGRDLFRTLVDGSTEARRNYIIFSLYTTNFMGRSVTSLGILGRFIPLSIKS